MTTEEARNQRPEEARQSVFIEKEQTMEESRIFIGRLLGVHVSAAGTDASGEPAIKTIVIVEDNDNIKS